MPERPTALALAALVAVASAAPATAQIYTRRTPSGVVEATNIPGGRGFRLVESLAEGFRVEVLRVVGQLGEHPLFPVAFHLGQGEAGFEKTLPITHCRLRPSG